MRLINKQENKAILGPQGRVDGFGVFIVELSVHIRPIGQDVRHNVRAREMAKYTHMNNTHTRHIDKRPM